MSSLMFDRLRNVIIAAAAILTIIPGASLLTGLVSMPPDFNNFLSFCAAVVGPIIFFLVYLARTQLLRLPRLWLLSGIAVSTIAGLVLAWQTYSYTVQRIMVIPYGGANRAVVERQFIVPEQLSPPLQSWVHDRHRGNWENAILEGGDTVVDLMRQDSLPVQRRIVILFLLAQALLIFACLLAGWAVVRHPDARRSPAKSAETERG